MRERKISIIILLFIFCAICFRVVGNNVETEVVYANDTGKR